MSGVFFFPVVAFPIAASLSLYIEREASDHLSVQFLDQAPRAGHGA